MTSYKIKLHGLSQMDDRSLRSMLSLSKSLLNHHWEIIDQGDAELNLFSLETDEGQLAWQAFTGTLAIILGESSIPKQSTTLFLKKPLRTKNFAEVINDAEKKVTFIKDAAQIAKSSIDDMPVEQAQPRKKNRKSLFKSLSTHFSAKKSPLKNLPSLDLYLPDLTTSHSEEAITDPTMLGKWISALDINDIDTSSNKILRQLQSLNTSELDVKQRYKLLEIYKSTLSEMVFNRNSAENKREINTPKAYLKTVKLLTKTLEQHTFGYKLIIDDFYHQGKSPLSEDLFLTSIIKTAECFALLITHCYRHYRAEPDHALNELHQLYVYCEASKTLDKTINTPLYTTNKSFNHYYCQSMLLGISAPYSLAKFNVLRLFKLMALVAKNVKIEHPNSIENKSQFNTQTTGVFFIDGRSDDLPKSYNQFTQDILEWETTRVFNVAGVLKAIENIFQQYKESNRGSDLDLQLLKKVTPQINASYQRKYQRIYESESQAIGLAYGIKNIHQQINLGNNTQGLDSWQIKNHDKHGMMLSTPEETRERILIGELIGLFDGQQAPQLATIRWMETDNNETTTIGLELHSFAPQTISLSANNQKEMIYGLLLESENIKKRPSSIIVDKGTFSINRQFHMKHSYETHSIMATDLIKNNDDYEHFNFIIQSNN